MEIRHSLGRFLSIAAIVALGVSFFAGIKASAPDMKLSADAHFDDSNTQDIQVFSTLGLDADNLKAIQALPGVEDVQAAFSQDYLANKGRRQLTVKAIAWDKDQKLNIPRLMEGRLPQKEDECVIEAESATNQMYGNWNVGDTITLLSGNDEPVSDTLKIDTFTIVGKAYNPNYLSYEKGTSAIGSGSVDTFIYIPWDAVAADYYTEIDATVQGAAALNTYSDAYFDTVSPVVDEIEAIAQSQIDAFVQDKQKEVDKARQEADEKLEEAQNKIDDGKSELDEGRQKLEEARREIDENKAALASGQKELEEGWAQYSASVAKLEDGLAKLNEGIAQMESARSKLPQLQSQKEQLNSALSGMQALLQAMEQTRLLDQNKTQLEASIASLQQMDPQNPQLPLLQENLGKVKAALDTLANGAGLPDGSSAAAIEAAYAGRLKALEEQAGTLSQIQASLEQIDDGIAQIESQTAGLEDLKAQKAQLEQNQQQLQQAKAQLSASQSKLDNGLVQLEEGQEEYEKGLASLQQAQKELEDGQQEFALQKEEAAEKIADAQQKIDDLDGKWIILDRNSHYSYRDYEACAQRMDGISSVFPVFFYLVAALVCMTTMTRMVDEQRLNMGTLKALGYSKLQIAMKYVLYALSASLIGCVVGCAVGMIVFPYVIFTAWNAMYNLEAVHFAFDPGLIFLASGGVIAVVMAATLASIAAELMEVPAQLMRPKAAKAGSKILLERLPWLWNRISFLHKVTLRNLFRYKKRFFMTVIGIAGCSALLVAGFGLNDSISDIVPAQFERIYHYDATVSLDKDQTDSQGVIDAVAAAKGISQSFDLQVLPISIRYDDKDVAAYLNIVEDPKAFAPFMTFHPMMDTDPDQSLDDSGVFIAIKTAEKLGVRPGDSISFKTADDQVITTKVAGVFEQYIEHQIYVTKALFDSWHVLQAPSDSILLRLDSTEKEDQNAVGAELMDLEGVSSVTFYSSLQKNFLDMISSIKIVVVVLVLSAAMLAFVVLYNLSNVNISERMREIATIKVLGFTEKEVNAYVNRESLLLALIGGAAGLILGIYLHDMIMNLAELDTIRFGRTILPLSFGLSLGLTMVFALAVNWIMKFRLRKIEMVESLKAVE